MAASIRYEDRLDGISNYLQWKVRLSAVLKENKIYSYVSSVVAAPAADPVALDLHEVKEARAQRIILDGVKDHLIPHLAEKKTAKEMWDALKNLFEAKNENRKMALRAKLHDTKMGKEESVSSYLTRVAQVKDELAAVGEVTSDSELVRIALNGFTKDWEVFVKCVVGREHLPDWSRLWDDFTQEEIRERSQSSDQKTDRAEENIALAAKSKKKGSSGRDLSKVRCYCCNQLGHLASQCPERKKKKKESEGPETAATAAIEDFASKFDREFSLVTLVSSVGSGGFGGDVRWIVDSGASNHMTGIWRVFPDFTEIGPGRQVVNEGGMARAVRGVGNVRFQLEFGGLLEIDGVLFVPGLSVNLLSVSALQDVGYCVLFKREHVFIYREGVDPVELQLIGNRVDRLYMLRGQPMMYDSASDEEREEAPETAVAPRYQSCIPREESESLLSTGRRLNQVDRTDAQDEVSSGFREVARRRSSSSSSVQVLRMAPGSEGAPTEHSVMGPDDGDGSEYIPR
jgi:hypothetical protein